MKSIWFPVLCALCIGFVSCNDDDGFVFDPELMHYDGANANAPFVPDNAAVVEYAAQFGQDAMSFYSGKEIDGIQFFLYEIPDSVEMLFYGDGPGDEPGPQFARIPLDTAALQSDGWNIFNLNGTIPLPADEMWVSLKVFNSQGKQVMGCDSGPAQNVGDWNYESTDNQWLTFRERSTDNINWNIRVSMTD